MSRLSRNRLPRVSVYGLLPIASPFAMGRSPYTDIGLLRYCDRLDRTALDYFTVDAEGLLVERPSIRTMFLALSISRSCKIFFARVHSPSVK